MFKFPSERNERSTGLIPRVSAIGAFHTATGVSFSASKASYEESFSEDEIGLYTLAEWVEAYYKQCSTPTTTFSRVIAIKLYRNQHGVGLREAVDAFKEAFKEAVNVDFESLCMFLRKTPVPGVTLKFTRANMTSRFGWFKPENESVNHYCYGRICPQCDTLHGVGSIEATTYERNRKDINLEELQLMVANYTCVSILLLRSLCEDCRTGGAEY